MSPGSLTSRLAKFAITGLCATALHFVIVLYLVEHHSFRPPNANLVAFSMATSFAFFVNTYWSFGSSYQHRKLYRYLLVACGGALLTWLISYMFEKMSIDYRLGVLAVTCLVPPVVFVLHQLWTYRT